MIENLNESELEAYLRRVVKHTGNLSGQKSDRGNEKSALRVVKVNNKNTTIHTSEVMAGGGFSFYFLEGVGVYPKHVFMHHLFIYL